jgi:hypothetical protein
VNAFYVAHRLSPNFTGGYWAAYTRGAFGSAEEALRDACRDLKPGQRYEVRRVTKRAWAAWSRGDHSQPVEGQVVAGGDCLQRAS